MFLNDFANYLFHPCSCVKELQRSNVISKRVFFNKFSAFIILCHYMHITLHFGVLNKVNEQNLRVPLFSDWIYKHTKNILNLLYNI